MTNLEKTMYAALLEAHAALYELSNHISFEGDAPEFNEGGVGYEASQNINAALKALEHATTERIGR